ncbi:hypothetical protein ACHWQZ_G018374 [Mnemiopsis leidyi]
MRWGERPHHPAVTQHGVSCDDGFQILHLIVLPIVFSCVVYFEVMDSAEEWYKTVKEKYPSDGPNREILISFTLVTLLLHGIGSFVVWRRCGGYRKNFIILASWEISVITYILAFLFFFTDSVNSGVTLICASWGITLMTTVLFLKADKWAVALALPFLSWTSYLSYSGINITRIVSEQSYCIAML